MDYASLVAPKSTPGSLASWANYGLAPASDVLGDAQSLIFMTLRVREMQSDSTAVAVALGACSTPLPAGFLDPISLRNVSGQRLKYTNVDGVLDRRAMTDAGAVSSGPLGAYAIFGEKFQFDAAVLADTPLSAVYFKRPDDLSNANPTNFLTTRYPMLLRTACLAVAADFRKHTEDYSRTTQRLLSLIQQVNVENDLYLRGVEVDADYRSL